MLTPMSAHDDVRAVREAVLEFARMGDVLHAAVAAHLGEEITGNATVGTLLQLDLEGQMRPGQIQDLTGLSSGGVTKMLDRLEAAGLVVREYGVIPQDRRGSVVRITRKGQRMTGRIAESVMASLPEVRVHMKQIDAILG
jgi:DNA-binding MarR family transcriptional regulator